MFSKELTQKQEIASKFFSKSLEKNQLARAYLLVGHAQSDKLKFIKELNQCLNCELNKGFMQFQAEESIQTSSLFDAVDADIGTATDVKFTFQEACGQCQNCRWIEEGNHPKTPIRLAPESTTKPTIKVEAIREVLNELSHNSDSFRIIIIEDASSKVLNRHSATALLKSVEEANANTLFVLLADSRDTVLNTITSRSQVVPFNSTEHKTYSEEAHDLEQELKQAIDSGNLSSRLAQLVQAEKLAESETNLLIELLQIMQNNIDLEGEHPVEAAQSSLRFEQAISDLRRFVRPKIVFENLLNKI